MGPLECRMCSRRFRMNQERRPSHAASAAPSLFPRQCDIVCCRPAVHSPRLDPRSPGVPAPVEVARNCYCRRPLMFSLGVGVHASRLTVIATMWIFVRTKGPDSRPCNIVLDTCTLVQPFGALPTPVNE